MEETTFCRSLQFISRCCSRLMWWQSQNVCVSQLYGDRNVISLINLPNKRLRQPSTIIWISWFRFCVFFSIRSFPFAIITIFNVIKCRSLFIQLFLLYFRNRYYCNKWERTKIKSLFRTWNVIIDLLSFFFLDFMNLKWTHLAAYTFAHGYI